MSGGLRKRTTAFVQIPSATIQDSRLSFRARGILAYLLDKPDGWDVRSEAIANDSPPNRDGKPGEGRQAIRTALKELGEFGYYRLERRRLLDGTFTMGTAISETPDPAWAAAWDEYSGRAVPMIQQRDGTFLVSHKDGSTTSDGFEPPAPASDPEPDGDGPSGGGIPTGDCSPDSGQPDSGQPDSGSLGPSNKTLTEDAQKDSDASLRSASAGASHGDGGGSTLKPGVVTDGDTTPALPLEGVVTGEDTPAEPTVKERAAEMARARWNEMNPRPMGRNAWHSLLAVCEAALRAGWTPEQTMWGLRQCGGVPSNNHLDRVLRAKADEAAGRAARGGPKVPNRLAVTEDAQERYRERFG